MRQTVLTVDIVKAMAEEKGIPWEDGYSVPFLRARGWWASDERPDRAGDIVLQNWHLEAFAKSGPILFGHVWDRPPIGRAIFHQVEPRKDADFTGPALGLIILFALDDADADFRGAIARLVNSNMMTTGSVGFFPNKVIHIDDEEERAQLGLGRWGVIFDENELAEFSLTPVPAHPGALSRYLERGCRRGLFTPAHQEPLLEIYANSVQAATTPVSEDVLTCIRDTFKDVFGKGCDETPEVVEEEEKEDLDTTDSSGDTLETRMDAVECALERMAEVLIGHCEQVTEGVIQAHRIASSLGQTSECEDECEDEDEDLTSEDLDEEDLDEEDDGEDFADEDEDEDEDEEDDDLYKSIVG